MIRLGESRLRQPGLFVEQAFDDTSSHGPAGPADSDAEVARLSARAADLEDHAGTRFASVADRSIWVWEEDRGPFLHESGDITFWPVPDLGPPT